MKRVIFIISELNSGGTQKTVKHLIDKFYNDNFIVKIITFEKRKNYNLKKKLLGVPAKEILFSNIYPFFVNDL